MIQKKCDFALTLACMRKITDGSYNNFGMRDKKNDDNITSFLNLFSYLQSVSNWCMKETK